MSHYFIPNPAVEFFNTIAPFASFESILPDVTDGWISAQPKRDRHELAAPVRSSKDGLTRSIS